MNALKSRPSPDTQPFIDFDNAFHPVNGARRIDIVWIMHMELRMDTTK